MGVAYDIIFRLLQDNQNSTQTFLICHMVYSNDMKINLSGTRGPLSLRTIDPKNMCLNTKRKTIGKLEDES